MWLCNTMSSACWCHSDESQWIPQQAVMTSLVKMWPHSRMWCSRWRLHKQGQWCSRKQQHYMDVTVFCINDITLSGDSGYCKWTGSNRVTVQGHSKDGDVRTQVSKVSREPHSPSKHWQWVPFLQCNSSHQSTEPTDKTGLIYFSEYPHTRITSSF